MSLSPLLPEVNELSHPKLEELCNKTGGRGRWQRLPQLVHLSPSRETELTSAETPKPPEPPGVSMSVPPASINTSPRLHPDQSLLVFGS